MHEEDEGALKELYSQLAGKVAEVARKVGVRRQHMLFDPEVQQSRLTKAIRGATVMDQVDKSGKPITTIHALIAALETDDREQPRPRTGEEYEPTRLSEYYEMIMAVEAEDSKLNSMIEEAQNKDTFTKTMKGYLSSGQLPQELLPLLIEEDSEIDEDEDEDKALPKQKRHTAKERRNLNKLAESVLTMAPHFTVSSNGLLLRLKQRKGHNHQELAQELEMFQQIYIPKQAKVLQRELVRMAHTGKGHAGSIKTYQVLMRTFTWDGSFNSCRKWVKTCATCQHHSFRSAKAPLLGHTIATRPGEHLALDVVHLPKAKGYEYVLTAIDVYSRYGFVIPLSILKTAAMVEAFQYRLLPLGIGKPDAWLTDGGSEFKDEVKQAIQAWNALQHMHAPHHHESAGIIEVYNRTLERKIAKLKDSTKCTWYDVYPDAVDITNATPSEACSDGITAAISPAGAIHWQSAVHW